MRCCCVNRLGVEGEREREREGGGGEGGEPLRFDFLYRMYCVFF